MGSHSMPKDGGLNTPLTTPVNVGHDDPSYHVLGREATRAEINRKTDGHSLTAAWSPSTKPVPEISRAFKLPIDDPHGGRP